jgi:hypothetical protein
MTRKLPKAGKTVYLVSQVGESLPQCRKSLLWHGLSGFFHRTLLKAVDPSPQVGNSPAHPTSGMHLFLFGDNPLIINKVCYIISPTVTRLVPSFLWIGTNVVKSEYRLQ